MSCLVEDVASLLSEWVVLGEHLLGIGTSLTVGCQVWEDRGEDDILKSEDADLTLLHEELVLWGILDDLMDRLELVLDI